MQRQGSSRQATDTLDDELFSPLRRKGSASVRPPGISTGAGEEPSPTREMPGKKGSSWRIFKKGDASSQPLRAVPKRRVARRPTRAADDGIGGALGADVPSFETEQRQQQQQIFIQQQQELERQQKAHTSQQGPQPDHFMMAITGGKKRLVRDYEEQRARPVRSDSETGNRIFSHGPVTKRAPLSVHTLPSRAAASPRMRSGHRSSSGSGSDFMSGQPGSPVAAGARSPYALRKGVSTDAYLQQQLAATEEEPARPYYERSGSRNSDDGPSSERRLTPRGGKGSTSRGRAARQRGRFIAAEPDQEPLGSDDIARKAAWIGAGVDDNYDDDDDDDDGDSGPEDTASYAPRLAT